MFIRKCILLFIFVLSIHYTEAQDVSNDIVQYIQSGNTKELAKYFNKRIDVTINQTGNNYSSDQAELIIKNFLSAIPNKEFTILQKGSTEYNTRFIVGVLKSKNEKYKTYILLKPFQKILYIQDIRFEKE
ncbi:MAG TPA: DUF4783 domain-containing protein [Chitinophagales bacterium]|nr:DUF4783 domain-containing protein [Chitinophagales bacterium]HMV02137.1 DUF4783 domain-containing protein [Chitinophagales bacterium]HMW93937.1 DUF4783 domain-containing protein [Chitinophagales bacterium]HMY42675.1 DUF4783 domain-containing protein [Chitinophagales bacterium]HNC63378.1 DUF4783 domain-containing protein [Chitinophagales bacterium]